ncbi:MAG: ferrous iron transport protein A [Leptospiraceae bacterium]|nr:ferrous iron transport protein A [Leptospiraceae bacterium]MCP5512725.1 ferrous iron transport protein A [Leptospiraceae bacterium]
MKLDSLAEGSSAILESFSSSLAPDFVNDMMDNGLLPGTKIILLKKYPSQKKVLLRVGELDLVLRAKDAGEIGVKES